jgi:hypothetical protein
MPVITQYGSLSSLQDSLTSLLCDIRDLRTGEIPRSMDLRAAPTIDKWSYGLVPARCVAGSVRGHPILGNLARVHTSELILIDPGHGPGTIASESPNGPRPVRAACNRRLLRRRSPRRQAGVALCCDGSSTSWLAAVSRRQIR